MTAQEYIKAMDMRQSRRSYQSRPLDSATRQVIKDLVDIVNKKADMHLQFIEEASSAFVVFGGRFSAIALCGDDSEITRIKLGYFGESIALQCTYHGLGTCWVTGTYDENKALSLIDLPEGLRLYGLLVIGNVKSRLSPKEKIMYNVTHKNSKPYQKMIEVSDKKLPPYFEYAMTLVEKAPSSTNSRPVHFRYENGEMRGYVDQPYSDKSIDFGIAQFHFTMGCDAMGVKGEWDKTGRFCVTDARIIKFPDEKGEE